MMYDCMLYLRFAVYGSMGSPCVEEEIMGKSQTQPVPSDAKVTKAKAEAEADLSDGEYYATDGVSVSTFSKPLHSIKYPKHLNHSNHLRKPLMT